jgi:hypothetical protein
MYGDHSQYETIYNFETNDIYTVSTGSAVEITTSSGNTFNNTVSIPNFITTDRLTNDIGTSKNTNTDTTHCYHKINTP